MNNNAQSRLLHSAKAMNDIGRNRQKIKPIWANRRTTSRLSKKMNWSPATLTFLSTNQTILRAV